MGSFDGFSGAMLGGIFCGVQPRNLGFRGWKNFSVSITIRLAAIIDILLVDPKPRTLNPKT